MPPWINDSFIRVFVRFPFSFLLSFFLSSWHLWKKKKKEKSSRIARAWPITKGSGWWCWAVLAWARAQLYVVYLVKDSARDTGPPSRISIRGNASSARWRWKSICWILPVTDDSFELFLPVHTPFFYSYSIDFRRLAVSSYEKAEHCHGSRVSSRLRYNLLTELRLRQTMFRRSQGTTTGLSGIFRRI